MGKQVTELGLDICSVGSLCSLGTADQACKIQICIVSALSGRNGKALTVAPAGFEGVAVLGLADTPRTISGSQENQTLGKD